MTPTVTFLILFLSFLLGKYSDKITSKLFSRKIRKIPRQAGKKIEKKYNFENADLKMVFLVREDLKMGKGKIAAQVAHAAVGLFDDIISGNNDYQQSALDYWNTFGAKKIVLKVPNLDIINNVSKQCKDAKLPYVIISDAGHTQIPAGSITVLGIGPDSSEKINKITGGFKLMS